LIISTKVEVDTTKTELISKCEDHFRNIYSKKDVTVFIERLQALLNKYGLREQEFKPVDENWTHKDHILITYADMISCDIDESRSPLAKQHQFLKEFLQDQISTVHILPFFPSSSDDGFSVIDYRRVDEEFGSWKNIEKMSGDFRLMGDLVINHISRHSKWFQYYLRGKEPYNEYFIEVDPEKDLSGVTRPRSSPLLTQVETTEGKKLIWTTFSHDQKDLNFKNPDVLFEFLDIFFFYVSRGLDVIRMDAVAFIWKEIGTNCIHLPQTHEIIKLFRTLVDHYMPEVTLITETNVPHRENISYFGDGDEAHMVYQFSLPPLLLHAILTENGSYLTQWASSLEGLPEGCTYFNFTASHDGIGMRPLEGLIPEDEFNELVEGVHDRGGFVSYKENPDKSLSPYELNITYFDAFATRNGTEELHVRRYLCSQIIMLSLQGVPGIYFHNLTGTQNNVKGVLKTGRYRTINRKKWEYNELLKEVEREDSASSYIFNRYRELLDIRRQESAFHPFGTQQVYNAGSDYFIIERVSPDKAERILVICNLTAEEKQLDLAEYGISVDEVTKYPNLLKEGGTVKNGKALLEPYGVIWIKP
jgi:glycosidase